ncbi:MAG: hypothetical protein K2K37_11990 [Muribaculaceae bacterium]|nr:hypothetical protein [Muribaculaceae bacterium]
MNSGNTTDRIMRRVRQFSESHPVAACVATVIGSGAIWYALFGFTPLGHLLPNRFDPAVRQGYEMLAARVDSLQRAADLNCRHADLIRSLITGDLDSVAVDLGENVAVLLPPDSLPDAGEAERAFVERIEASNLQVRDE